MYSDTESRSASVVDDNSSSSSRTAKLSKSDTRRPATRSQTGTLTKRPAPDDHDHDVLPEPKRRAPSARKRHKSTSNSSSETIDSTISRTASPKPPLTREASLCSTTSSAPVDTTTQFTFYHASMLETDQSQNRLPRSRASLPTPIPNLTKKSRGRRVPTKDSPYHGPEQKANRLYVCSVDGCGKCFHRGEHLKRHIRSIHTHEKPFKCTYAMCDKFFNRHDNLLQHLKVHRQADSLPDQSPKGPLQEDSHDVRALSAPRPRYSQTEEEEEDEVPSPPRPRTIYDALPPRYGSFPASSSSSSSSSSVSKMTYGHNTTGGEKSGKNVADGAASMQGNMEAMSILTDVAVSSLRMEVSSLRTEQHRKSVGGTKPRNP